MSYYVEAYRSRSLCKAYAVMELKDKPMYFGPWKRLKTAKKKATELRKDRVVCMARDETEYHDRGPSFTKVRILTKVAEQ